MLVGPVGDADRALLRALAPGGRESSSAAAAPLLRYHGRGAWAWAPVSLSKS